MRHNIIDKPQAWIWIYPAWINARSPGITRTTSSIPGTIMLRERYVDRGESELKYSSRGREKRGFSTIEDRVSCAFEVTRRNSERRRGDGGNGGNGGAIGVDGAVINQYILLTQWRNDVRISARTCPLDRFAFILLFVPRIF